MIKRWIACYSVVRSCADNFTVHSTLSAACENKQEELCRIADINSSAMSTKLKDNKPRATPRRQVCCTTSFFIISTIGILAMVSLLLFNTHIAGLSASLLYKMEGKLGFIHRNVPVKSLVLKKTFLEMKPYGGWTPTINASIGRIKAQRILDSLVKSPLEPFRKRNGSFDLHFIHIPKCGGTSFTAVLREVACKIDGSRNNDCCTNPGNIE